MIRVRIAPSGHELELAPRERLLDALDDAPGGGIPFACRGAHCGSCAVRVLEGADALEPAREDEQRTLRELGLPEGARLACQVEASPASAGQVVLHVMARPSR